MRSRYLLFLFFSLVLLILISCRLISLSPTKFFNSLKSIPTSSLVPESKPTQTEQIIPITSRPDPLNDLLLLRSVRITLTSQRPNESLKTIAVEIDSYGNMHIRYDMPVIITEQLPPGLNVSKPVSSYEVYVIDEKAFMPSETNPDWRLNPIASKYSSSLSDQMHSLDGFVLWLDILPKGSLEYSGSESLGGFSANRFTINGLIIDQYVTGMLWYDNLTNALVKAELHVPANLDHTGGEPVDGEIFIQLDAERAEIPPVKLP